VRHLEQRRVNGLGRGALERVDVVDPEPCEPRRLSRHPQRLVLERAGRRFVHGQNGVHRRRRLRRGDVGQALERFKVVDPETPNRPGPTAAIKPERSAVCVSDETCGPERRDVLARVVG
jgi:hypothetical protein